MVVNNIILLDTYQLIMLDSNVTILINETMITNSWDRDVFYKDIEGLESKEWISIKNG